MTEGLSPRLLGCDCVLGLFIRESSPDGPLVGPARFRFLVRDIVRAA